MSITSLHDLQQIENLELLAKQVAEGFIIGLHKSPFHGFSVEFAEHRLYNQGESTKNIDWKVYARTDRLYTKRYEEETNLRCQLVIDASSSMYYPDKLEGKDAVNKIRFSVVAAAALQHLLRKQRDAVGLSIFSDKVLEHSKSRSNTVHHRLLQSQLEQLLQEQPQQQKTNAAQCLHQIADSIHKRSLVIVFSDMMDNLDAGDEYEELFSALQHLRYNKHEVILFHVVDKKHELDFAFDSRPYVFVDLETGEKVRLHANQVKQQYVEQMEKFKKQLELRCGQYNIDFVEADVNKGFSQVLMPYLMKRTKLF